MTAPSNKRVVRRFLRITESSRVGWVLTGVTCLVLAIGVSMIRQVSTIDRPEPIEPTDDGDTASTANSSAAPEKLVLRPIVPSGQPSGTTVTPPEDFDLDGDRY